MEVVSTVCTLFFIVASMQATEALRMERQTFPLLVIPNCSSIQPIIEKLHSDIRDRIIVHTECGAGEWHPVAYLNMSDPSQQCPSAWREYNANNITFCGRNTNSKGSCSSTSFSITSGPYSRVCGRVIGYQFASTDGFQQYANNDIDLDGINITRGAQHTHIWSYVSGGTQNISSQSRSKCPCFTDNGQGSEPPSSIGDNYYCESGNLDERSTPGYLYSDDPLWDGQQCEGTCCTGTNSPPWFRVQLPAPTTDTIEVSICADQSTKDEDTPIALLEIYVQ